MSIQDGRAVYGLSGVGTNSRTNVSGSATIGVSQTSVNFPDGDEGYSVRMIFASTSAEAAINIETGDTTGTDAFTAGTAQVESVTITAASGATSNGNLPLVLTAAGLTGSPLTVNVALTTAAHTTDALIAAACRTTLAANTAVAALFTVGGTSTGITLTRKPTSEFTVPDGTLPLYPANDGTLELVVPTALGVTGATSSNTTAGVASSGVKLYDEGVNFEGKPIEEITLSYGHLYRCDAGQIGFSHARIGAITSGEIILLADASGIVINDATFVAESAPADLTLTIIGKKA